MIELPRAASGRPGSELTLSGEPGGALVRRSVLPGGVRVLTEAMPGQRSVAIGLWVGVGSRDEAAGHFGSTHFLEHLLFKGTARRTALDIAQAFDRVGGESNAATGKEHTAYYARVLSSDLPMAVDVLADMITSATLDPVELDHERGVILEELAMNEDDPGDVVHEKFVAAVLAGHDLGRPIGGTPDMIRAVPRDAVWDHYREHYRPDELVVTAAGDLDHDALVGLVTAALGRAGWPEDADALPAPRRRPVAAAPRVESAPVVTTRDTEQANVLLGVQGVTATDPRRFALSVLSAVLGGGMSSRLFQEIRERRGLAYSVYSFGQGYTDAGYFGLYAGCAPSHAAEVVGLLGAELERLGRSGVTEAELADAVGQLRGSSVLGLEDPGSRMSRLGRAELVHGQYLTIDEALARISAVTVRDVAELAEDLAARPRALSVVGPFDHWD